MPETLRSSFSGLRRRPGFKQILWPLHAAWRGWVNVRGMAMRGALLRHAAEIPAVEPGDAAAVTSLVRAATSDFSGYIWPMQMPGELRSFLEILGKVRPKTYLEIGTAGGGTLFAVSRVINPTAEIISVDLPGGLWGGGYPRWKTNLYRHMVLPQQHLHLIRGDSHQPQSLQQVKEILAGRPLDAIFIDGDHTYDGVKKDFEMYTPLVRPGGVVGFHDIVDHPNRSGGDVPRFWKELCQTRQCQELIEDPAQGYGIGVMFVPNAQSA